MIPLLYVAAAVSLAAIIVTVHAIMKAPDGFEDEHGFHAVRTEAEPELRAESGEQNGDAPPLSAL